MITIAIYKLDTATIKTIKRLIKKYFHDNDRNNTIEYKILVVKDEDDLVGMFKFGWMSILILPSNDAISSYFKETNMCMQMIYMIESAESTVLTSYKSDEDFLTKPISSKKFNPILIVNLENL